MKVWNFFIRWGSLMLLLLAALCALRDGMQVNWWTLEDFLIICGGVSFFVTVIYSHKIATGAGLVLAVAFLAWLGSSCRTIISEAATRLIQHVIPLINVYYRTNFVVTTSIGTSHSRPLLLLVTLLMGLFIGAGIVRPRWRWLFYLPLLLAFLTGFLLGYAPELMSVVCLICGLGLTLLILKKGETNEGRSTRILGAVCLAIVIGAAGIAYGPLSEQILARHDDMLQFQLSLEDKALEIMHGSSFWDRMLWNAGMRQTAARLSNDPPYLGKDVIFEITMEDLPINALYVKNFTGGSYDNGVWSPPSEAEFAALAAEQGMSVQEYGARIQNAFFEAAGRTQMSEPQNIRIRILRHTGDLSLMPYFCEIPENARIVGDSGLRFAEDTYEFRTYSFQSTYMINFFSPSVSEYVEYDEYVDRVYTTLPQGQLERLRSDPLEAMVTMARDCRYSFDLSPVPEGWDIVEYFLLEEQKGYCMHFASAAVLLERMLDLPARYASGYLVLPSDFIKNEDGTYTASITGQRAHAWMEYYFEGCWYPIEVTPSSYTDALMENPGRDVAGIVGDLEGQGSPDQQEPTPADDLTEPEDTGLNGNLQEPEVPVAEQETGQQEQPPTDDPSYNGQADTDSKGDAALEETGMMTAVMVLLRILCIILLVVVFVYLQRLRLRLVRERRERRFMDTDMRRGAQAVQQAVFRLLDMEGLGLSDMEDELEFAGRVEKALSCLTEGEFRTFIEIARAVRYGGGAITEEERDHQYQIYQKLIQWEKSRMNRRQHFWYVHVLARL